MREFRRRKRLGEEGPEEFGGFRHKKRFGQHFLAAPEILDEIAELLPLEGKTVLEIGAGDGALTQALAEKARKVVALEIDRELVKQLDKKFAKQISGNRIQIVQADALKADFTPFKLIFGNVPYNISTPLLLKIIKSNFSHAVLMLQSEFGERLVAPPGSREYSRLSVAVQSQAKAEIVDYVAKECFYPVPQVNSVLVHLAPKPARQVVHLDEKLVNALFQHPNQNLRKALKHSKRSLGEKRVQQFLEKIPADLLSKCARGLSLEEFAEISRT